MKVTEKKRFPWALVLAGLPVFLVLVSLGNWPMRRLEWKQNLLAEMEARSSAQPQSFDVMLNRFHETGKVDYLPVAVEGRFLHDFEAHFLATHQGRSGWYIYTPLQLPNGTAVIVNRGFVPYAMKDPAKRLDGQVAGRQRVTGLVRETLAAKPSTLVPDNDLQRNIFYWKDLDTMWARTGARDANAVAPFFIDADATANPGGLPVGGVTRMQLPNSHLQYALTWYGLALALAGVMAAFVWRWRRPHRQALDT